MSVALIVARRDSFEVYTAQCSERVGDVVARLAERRIGAVPVMRGSEVAGILSERDVVYGLAAEGPALLDRRVEEVMTAPAVTVEPATGIDDALALMTRRRIRHLPVVEGGRMTGLVSIGDLVKHRIDLIEAEAAAMRDYIRAV